MTDKLIDALGKAKEAMTELHTAYEHVSFNEIMNGDVHVGEYYAKQADELMNVLITVDNEFQKLTKGNA